MSSIDWVVKPFVNAASFWGHKPLTIWLVWSHTGLQPYKWLLLDFDNIPGTYIYQVWNMSVISCALSVWCVYDHIIFKNCWTILPGTCYYFWFLFSILLLYLPRYLLFSHRSTINNLLLIIIVVTEEAPENSGVAVRLPQEKQTYQTWNEKQYVGTMLLIGTRLSN